ncbi:unnamed protein product [Angiostrongylus costaricensis]|uniref:Ion_trans domain-containing protein n=1 Tax=Angiostrongylus costaricensis TaxID=334426 RepID=A0A158PHP8_ANGCS|nr:unnamed protein product [Angiostrongylus costaricensis]
MDETCHLLKGNGSVSSPTVLINVGGRRARLSHEMIARLLDDCRLSAFCRKSHIERLTDCDAYFEHADEYYFERSPVIFELRYELEYWRIPVHFLSPCCTLEDNSSISKKINEKIARESICPPSSFEKVWIGQIRYYLYRLLENPQSSLAAKVFSIVSACFVLFSLLGLILSSMPELQDEHKEPHLVLQWLEMCCMAYFTAEYLARFSVNPMKAKFVRSPLNVIDVLTILPFLIEMFNELQWMKNFRGAMLVVRVMRLARVARIFKLARYSTGLRAFGETMKKSAAELSMLGMFLLTGIMLFSTAIYFFERDEPNSKFYSIPAACWWCNVRNVGEVCK